MISCALEIQEHFTSVIMPFIQLKKLRHQDRIKDANVENGLEDTGRGKGKLGRSERVAWTYIHYQM